MNIYIYLRISFIIYFLLASYHVQQHNQNDSTWTLVAKLYLQSSSVLHLLVIWQVQNWHMQNPVMVPLSAFEKW